MENQGLITKKAGEGNFLPPKEAIAEIKQNMPKMGRQLSENNVPGRWLGDLL